MHVAPQPDAPQRPPVQIVFTNLLWRFWDNILLLQMGQSYVSRFHQYKEDVAKWRKSQLEEWNRLFTVLALLGTMHAAILALTPHPPPFATAVWLGGAGLSVAGLFIVQYFPIKSFSMTDEDIHVLVHGGNDYINTTLLAAAVASPVIITLWASILFLSGIVDYVIQTDIGGEKFRIIALIPLGFGVAAVVATLTIGEMLGRRIEARDNLELPGTSSATASRSQP